MTYSYLNIQKQKNKQILNYIKHEKSTITSKRDTHSSYWTGDLDSSFIRRGVVYKKMCCWCARVCVDLTSFFYYSSKIVGQYHWFSILESFRRLPPLYTPIIAICFIFL